ncbi:MULTISPECIES: hypothetical protein [unclassified Streptomyces]|uniref:hypothetical protein n=1 Tax=Streptomyces sp. NBC_00424 TaxID=2903648 RepID=UPI00224F1FAE|nr:hypothetical protein [Streptomyces sp. NBC_00424]
MDERPGMSAAAAFSYSSAFVSAASSRLAAHPVLLRLERRVSYDIFVCRFENGETVPLNMSAAHEVLDPFVVARDPATDFLLVSTADGEEAGVYFNSPTGITFNRFEGHGIMDLLAVLLRRLDAVLVVPGGPTILQRDEDREHLFPALRDEGSVLIARTGAEIDQAIKAS